MRALQHPEYRDLKDLRWRHLGLNLEQAAERCGVSPRVFQRWERQNKAPELALRLLRLLGGELGLIDPAWRDFHLVRGRLFYGEDPRGYEPGHVALLSSLLADRAVTAAERRKGCGAGIGKALPPTPAPEASDGLPPSSPESPSDSWPRSNWSLVGQSTPTPLGDRAHARASSKGQAAAKVGERGPNVLNTAYTLCELDDGADATRSPGISGACGTDLLGLSIFKQRGNSGGPESLRGVPMRALQHPEYRDLKDLRWRHLGLNLEQAAERCGVSPRVFQRWERQNKAPELALRLLRLLGGELGLIDPAWRDFHLVRGRLFYGEDPRGYEPGHVALLSSLLADRAVTAAERRKGCGAGIGKALPPTPAPEASDGLPPSSPESPSDSWPRSNWSLVGQSTPTPLGDRAHARASSKGQAAAKVGERGPNVLNTAYTLCEIYSGADGTRSPAGSGTDRGIAPRHAAVPDPMQWVAVGLAGIPLGTVIKSV